MEIKRYKCYTTDAPDFEAEADGEWVKYEDVKDILTSTLKTNVAITAENKFLADITCLGIATRFIPDDS